LCLRGDHLTHGFQTSERKGSATRVFHLRAVLEKTGLIDCDDMEKRATIFISTSTPAHTHNTTQHTLGAFLGGVGDILKERARRMIIRNYRLQLIGVIGEDVLIKIYMLTSVVSN